MFADAFVSQMREVDTPYTNNNYTNTAKAPNIKRNSPEVKDVCYFAERVRYMLDVKINHLRIAMYKSDNLPNIDIIG
jgi:hypothetical protein